LGRQTLPPSREANQGRSIREMHESLIAGTSRVARPAPLRQAVYEALAELIANGTLRPGQHLVESDLAEHLGVSRQPVREALQRLQGDGWVELRPAHGAFVHTPTGEEVIQLLEVRSALEAYSAYGAAQHATSGDIARLHEMQAAGEAALAADDQRELADASAAFHWCIVQMSGNKVLAGLISQVERRVRWYYTPIARPRGREAWIEHASLITAIADGDAERAQRLMRHHTERATESYRKDSAAAAQAPVG
jgi:DNA-binding GntR family transcriptional regulator